jgi:hypothetical protein
MREKAFTKARKTLTLTPREKDVPGQGVTTISFFEKQ